MWDSPVGWPFHRDPKVVEKTREALSADRLTSTTASKSVQVNGTTTVGARGTRREENSSFSSNQLIVSTVRFDGLLLLCVVCASCAGYLGYVLTISANCLFLVTTALGSLFQCQLREVVLLSNHKTPAPVSHRIHAHLSVAVDRLHCDHGLLAQWTVGDNVPTVPLIPFPRGGPHLFCSDLCCPQFDFG